MTSLLDLSIAVQMIVEVPTPVDVNHWIYGSEFQQLLTAIRVFREYYWERKGSWAIPQSLITELDGYIAQFPTPYFHYTIKAKDQNNFVDALNVIGKLTEYWPPAPPPPPVVGYLKYMVVHWLNPDGSIKQTFDYYANVRPKIPHWIDGVDYAEGNVKMDATWQAYSNRSIRLDTRLYRKWSKQTDSRVEGSCVSTPLVQEYHITHTLRMPSEDVSVNCWMMDCSTGTEYAYLPVPIDVTDISPPPPLTASIMGIIKGYFPNRSPTDQPLQGVKISVSTLSQLTDENGCYNVSNIPVGYHTWVAEKTGWRTIKVGEEYRSGDVKHRDAVMVPA